MDIKPDKKSWSSPSMTPVRVKSILKDIKEGSSNKRAAESNGISERHFYYSILQGICDLEHEKFDTIYAVLVQSLRKIEQEEIKECRKLIKENKKSHKGAEWTLEHVYWQEYGSDAKAKELDERLKRIEEGVSSHEKLRIKERHEENDQEV